MEGWLGMKVRLLNFGAGACRYLPMFELFLAAALETRGHEEVSIRTLMDTEPEEDFIRALAGAGEDTMVILWETLSSKSAAYAKRMVRFGRLYRERGGTVPLLIGGYWASSVARSYAEFESFDSIIVGYSIARLADAVDGWAQGQRPREIDARGQAEWDDYELAPRFLEAPEKYAWRSRDGRLNLMGYMSSFGCPNRCGFCYNRVLQNCGTEYVERSEARVEEDFETLDRAYGFDEVQFKDLNFFHDAERGLRILEVLRGRGKRVHGALDITVMDATEAIFANSARYGIRDYWIGLESFNEESLRRLNKDYSLEKLEQVFTWADRYRVNLFGNIMLGLPWEGRAAIETTLRVALETLRRHPYVLVMFNTIRPILGTPIQETYFPDIVEKVERFDEMMDLFSFRLAGTQQAVYGEETAFIDLEAVHNAFKVVNLVRVIQNNPRTGSAWLPRAVAWFVLKQLEPPYFSRGLSRRLFRCSDSTYEAFLRALRLLITRWPRRCGPGTGEVR